jgi:hypothetical protein
MVITKDEGGGEEGRENHFEKMLGKKRKSGWS